MFLRSEPATARIAANRANAALSTGPRTAQGKSASSKNATSHGLYAAIVVVHHWENQADFDLLRQQYCERFCPLDRVESDIVDRMVDSEWRRNRVISIETTLFNLEIDEMAEEIADTYTEPEDGLLRVTHAFRKHHGEGVWDAVQRHLAAIDRAFQRAMRDLRLLQGERFSQMPVVATQPEEAPETVAEVAESVEIAEIVEISERSHRPPTQMIESTEKTENQSELSQEIDANGTESQSEFELAA